MYVPHEPHRFMVCGWHTYVYTCIHICTYIHIYIHIQICTYIYMYIYDLFPRFDEKLLVFFLEGKVHGLCREISHAVGHVSPPQCHHSLLFRHPSYILEYIHRNTCIGLNVRICVTMCTHVHTVGHVAPPPCHHSLLFSHPTYI